MKVLQSSRLILPGEDGQQLDIRTTNRGEPYREGVEMWLHDDIFHLDKLVFLEEREVILLRDFLVQITT